MTRMGTTTNHDLPYPEDSDLVIQGDDAIEALAVAVDAKLGAEAYLNIQPSEGSQSIVAGGSTIGFDGTVLAQQFTYFGGLITYTGAGRRAFLVCTGVGITNGGGSSAYSALQVRHNDGNIADSSQQAEGAVLTATHTISVPVHLESGDEVIVVGFAAPTGDLDVNWLRIYPMGPVL